MTKRERRAMMTRSIIRNKVMQLASGKMVHGGMVPYGDVIRAMRDQGRADDEQLTENEKAIWTVISRQSHGMEGWRYGVVTYRQAWEVACMSHTDFGVRVRTESTKMVKRAMRELHI